MQWIISDEFRKDLKKLVSLLTNKPDLQWMYDVIDNYEFEDDEADEFESEYPLTQEELIAFQQVEILGEILQPEFMLHLDWREEVKELKLGIEDLLQNNFGISRVSLPSLRNYDDRTSISSDHVFSDFQRELKKQGFSLANIESGDDTYWIIVFPSAHYSQIEQLVNALGTEIK